ncbi:MAG TPA: alanine racemase [Firmicutes bacterium]|nr:alanine racemase [Bacillota bacterium]
MPDEVSDRPTRVDVDLSAIAHNVREIRRLVGPSREIMAVVKADAYGHGAEQVSCVALNSGATWLGVALVEEGIALRKSGILAPILVLSACFRQHARRAVRYGLATTVTSFEFAEAISLAATQESRKAKVHIKVDTGMGRLGITPQEALGFIRRVERLPNVEIEGIFTHLATADDDDPSFAMAQIRQFADVVRVLESNGISIPYKHVANSAALLRFPESYFNMVRPGIIIYGLSPFGFKSGPPDVHAKLNLRSALSFHTNVVFSKRVPAGFGISYGRTYVTPGETFIATIPVGYADGYMRALSNKAQVLIRGQRFPVVGRICMDQCMVDTGGTYVEPGEEVVIIGKQGTEEITADEVAAWAGTIGYEVTCAISKRVPRFYSNAV